MKPTPLTALYAHVPAPAAPTVPLVRWERRRAGEEFPAVVVGGGSWSRLEVAAALFEASADDAFADRVPSTDDLYAALRASVAELGPAGLAEVMGVFAEFEPGEFQEADACHLYAYRLALSFWYEGARSRPMTVGEAAVALYLSNAYRHHPIDPPRVPRAPLMVIRAIRHGAAQIPTPTLIHLGKAMTAEFTHPHLTCVTTPVTPPSHPTPDWLYRHALPDPHRRRFCFDLLRADGRQPSPLVVRVDGGTYAVGATPPAGPDGTWARTLRARW
ncbi:hypothetical protein [Streptomyces sp. NPDC049906]|uniref:hypothetical protein n=1 Tax=Streptomyces sp. NPDC049906 TaxID=3155656 RepID=UPI00342F54C5